MTLLWHSEKPIGICVFTVPPISLQARNRYFGRSGKWTRVSLQVLNRQLVMLSRVVLHPTYRGAGVAAPFIRRSCETCSWPWVETLTEMGHMNPFFERSGFTRVGISRTKSSTREDHSAIYGGRRNKHGKPQLISKETHRKSRYAQPVYYIFDNRQNKVADTQEETNCKEGSQEEVG